MMARAWDAFSEKRIAPLFLPSFYKRKLKGGSLLGQKSNKGSYRNTDRGDQTDYQRRVDEDQSRDAFYERSGPNPTESSG